MRSCIAIGLFFSLFSAVLTGGVACSKKVDDEPAESFEVPLKVEVTNKGDKVTVEIETKAKTNLVVTRADQHKPTPYEAVADSDGNARIEFAVTKFELGTKIRIKVEATLRKAANERTLEYNVVNPYAHADWRPVDKHDGEGIAGVGPIKLTCDAFCVWSTYETSKAITLGRDGTVDVEFTPQPGVEFVSFDGKKPEVKDGKVRLTFDYVAALATSGTAMASFKAPYVLKWKSDGYEEKGEMKFDMQKLELFFGRVKKGPMRGPSEPATKPGKPESLVVLGLSPYVVGKKGSFADVDLIGFIDMKDRSFGDCSYVNPMTKERKRLPLNATDVVAAVYDRRSGKSVGNRTFAGKRPECADTVSAKDRDTGSIGSFDDAKKWMEAFVLAK